MFRTGTLVPQAQILAGLQICSPGILTSDNLIFSEPSREQSEKASFDAFSPQQFQCLSRENVPNGNVF